MYRYKEIELLVFTLWGVVSVSAAVSTMDLAAANAIVQVSISEPLGPDSSRHLNIYCKMVPNEPRKLDFIYATYYVSSVTFHNCPPGVEDVAVILSAFGVTLDNVEEITLQDLPEAPVLTARHFEGLENLKKLTINGVKTVTPHSDFLVNLAGLEELNMDNLVLGPLPMHNKIERLTLSNGVSVGPLGSCEELRWLTIHNWTVPWNWLNHCSKLAVIKLNAISAFDILQNVPTVKEIIIRNSTLKSLSKGLLSSPRLLSGLKIVNSSLEDIESNAFENFSQSLLELDLSHNQLKGEIATALKPLKTLRKLTLSHNDLNNFCDHFSQSLSSLTTLRMSHCHLQTMCFDSLLTLTSIDLRHNDITNIDFDKLPLETERSFPLDVQLIGNPVEETSFSRTLFNSLDSIRKHAREPLAIIHLNSIKCKWDNDYFSQAVDMRFITVEGYQCKVRPPYDFDSIKTIADLSAENGLKFSDSISKFPEEKKLLKLHDEVNEKDEITNDGSNNNRTNFLNTDTRNDTEVANKNANAPVFENVSTTVPQKEERFGETNRNDNFAGFANRRYPCDQCNCEGSGTNVRAYCNGLQWIPQIKGMRELHAAGNSISSITLTDFTDSLEVIDLRNNRISRIHEETLRALFHLPQRRILLSGNPILCDCHNVPMLAELLNNEQQVDFRDIKCSNKPKKYLKWLRLEELCRSRSNRSVYVTANLILMAIHLVVIFVMQY